MYAEGRPIPNSVVGRRAEEAPSRQSSSLRRWAFVSLTAALVVAVLRAFVPFEHGIWLIAYLLLVGFLAPTLLGAGETALSDRDPGDARSNRQAALWAFGTVGVPVGVLAGSRLGVVLGSAALLLALAEMTSAALHVAANRSRPSRPVSLWGQLGLVAFMTLSVGIGVLLSWDSPWL